MSSSEKKITLNSSDGEESVDNSIPPCPQKRSSSEKKITLKSSDGEESVALQSQTIKHMIEDDCVDNSIPPCPLKRSSSEKKITLRCSDGEDFVIEKSVALQSKTIKQMIKDGCFQNSTPLHNVTTKILSKVTEYCNNRLESTSSDDEIKTFGAAFVKVDDDTLFAYMRAAGYLNIKTLIDLTCKTVADIIEGKTPEENLEFLNIRDDFVSDNEEISRIKNFLTIKDDSLATNKEISDFFDSKDATADENTAKSQKES